MSSAALKELVEEGPMAQSGPESLSYKRLARNGGSDEKPLTERIDSAVGLETPQAGYFT